MKQPLVSIIIPMYNAKKFIRKAMEHLIHQTYKNLEIIIVDDGSTDNCSDIIKQYIKQDKRITLITQKNAGVSVASNVGIKVAKGEYLHVHDHDDFVNLDYFEKMVNAAILTNADILCGEVNQPEYNFPKFNSMEICVSLYDKIEKTRANKFHPAWRYVYKTSFIKKNNLHFEPSVLGAQGKLFSRSAIVLADTVVTVPGAVYNVVNTITALGKDKKKIKASITEETKKAYDNYNKFMLEHGAKEFFEMPEKPFVQEVYKVFNKTIFRRDVYTRKIRTYLFGINIGTKHII